MIEAIFSLIFMFIWLIMMAIGIALTIFWIFMLIDCAKREFPKSDDKIMWIIVIALIGGIGAVVYYFVIKTKDKKPESTEKVPQKQK